MASLPVLSVWPTMLTVAAGLSLSVAAKRSSIGRKLALMSARPVSKETSLGMSILRRLSAVWLTCTPVPWVACCIARFWASILLDQILPTMAPAAAPSTAPPAARLPPPLPVPAPRRRPGQRRRRPRWRCRVRSATCRRSQRWTTAWTPPARRRGRWLAVGGRGRAAWSDSGGWGETGRQARDGQRADGQTHNGAASLTMPRRCRSAGALDAASANQAQQDHDDRDDQQDMDEAAQGVRGHQTEQPEYDQYYGDCIEHDSVLCMKF